MVMVRGVPSRVPCHKLKSVHACLLPCVLLVLSLIAAKMTEMGFTLEEIHDSLENNKFNNVTATYLLLGTERPGSAAAAAAATVDAVGGSSRSLQPEGPQSGGGGAQQRKGSSATSTVAASFAAPEDSTLEAPGKLTSTTLVYIEALL